VNPILCVLFECFDDSDFARKRSVGKDLVMFRLDLNSIPCSEFNSLQYNRCYPARIQAHFRMNGRLSPRQKERSGVEKEDIFLTASTRCIPKYYAAKRHATSLESWGTKGLILKASRKHIPGISCLATIICSLRYKYSRVLRLPRMRGRGTKLKSLSVTGLVSPESVTIPARHNLNSPWDSQPVWLSAVLFFALLEAFRRINSGYDEGRSNGRF
jgi:hypothetical protein